MKKDIYQKVTDKIIADLEQGKLTWLKPWSSANADRRIIKPLRHNGLPYSGINILMLWGAAMEGGYTSPYWMTFKQAKEFDAHVKKGERGNLVVYANTITKTEETSDGGEEERIIPFMKGYSVFNVEQIEGLPEHYYAEPPKGFSKCSPRAIRPVNSSPTKTNYCPHQCWMGLVTSSGSVGFKSG